MPMPILPAIGLCRPGPPHHCQTPSYSRKLNGPKWNIPSLESYGISDSWFQTIAVFWMLYVFFWVILHTTYLPMKVEQIECSETSVYKIQTPASYPEESIHISDSIALCD